MRPTFPHHRQPLLGNSLTREAGIRDGVTLALSCPLPQLKGELPLWYLPARISLFPQWKDANWRVLHGPLLGDHIGYPDFARRILWIREDCDLGIVEFADLIAHAIAGSGACDESWMREMRGAAHRARELGNPWFDRVGDAIESFIQTKFGDPAWPDDEVLPRCA